MTYLAEQNDCKLEKNEGRFYEMLASVERTLIHVVEGLGLLGVKPCCWCDRFFRSVHGEGLFEWRGELVCPGCVHEWWLQKSEHMETLDRKAGERLLVGWLLEYHNAKVVHRSSRVPSLSTEDPQLKVTCNQCQGAGRAGHERCALCEGLGTLRVLLSKDSGSQNGIIRIGEIELDPDRRVVRKSSKSIHLTPKEFGLLRQLMSNPGMPITYNRLLKAVWGPGYENEVEYIRTFVRQLRIKIEDDPGNPIYLLTENQVGYRFMQPE